MLGAAGRCRRHRWIPPCASHRPTTTTTPTTTRRVAGGLRAPPATVLHARLGGARTTPVGTAADRHSMVPWIAMENDGGLFRGSGAAMAGAVVAAAAAMAAWEPSEGVADCVSGAIGDEPYEPGQAIGAGLKAELWKGKHPNLTILETAEDTPVLGLLSLIRNAETEGEAFLSAANRLIRQMLDFAVMGLPSDEDALFVTPAGVMMRGVLPEEDLEVCAISLYLEHEHETPGVFDFELNAAFSSFERGSIRVRGLTRGSGKALPRDMAGKQVLLLTPVVVFSEPVLAALERLSNVGVKEEDVTLVCVVIGRNALEQLTTEAGDMSVVCAAMDGETRGVDDQIVPGVGDFSKRYSEAKKAVEEKEAQARVKNDKSGRQSGSRWRFWRRAG